MNGIGLDDDRLVGLDRDMIEKVCNEMMVIENKVCWDDIVGLQHIKQDIQSIVAPLKNPSSKDNTLHKGILIYGAPGTGKTMIAKALVQSTDVLFHLSAYTLICCTDGVELVKALFGVARYYQSSIIVIEDIDMMFGISNSNNESALAITIKTEFSRQWDRVISSNGQDNMILIGITNKIQQMGNVARSRMKYRIYIPLPDKESCAIMIKYQLSQQQDHTLSQQDIQQITLKTNNMTGSDIFCLCREVAMSKLRNIQDISQFDLNQVGPIQLKDFLNALDIVKPCMNQNELNQYIDWNTNYGSTTL